MQTPISADKKLTEKGNLAWRDLFPKQKLGHHFIGDEAVDKVAAQRAGECLSL
jgi:hypothetical protein